MSERENGRGKETYIQQFRQETVYQLHNNWPIAVTESPRYKEIKQVYT